MARGFRERESLRSFLPAPQGSRIESQGEKIDEEKRYRCRYRERRRAEPRSAGCLAPFDEYLQALRHDFHARARLLCIRSEWKEISRFSRRDSRKRAGLF